MIEKPPQIPEELLATNRIRVDKDGVWYHDNHEITHARTVDLYNRSIDWDKDGNYYLHIGRDVIPLDVDDVPFRVMDVNGTPAAGFEVVLSDGESEPLDAASLRVGDDEALYCTVKGGYASARFTRAAQARIGKYVTEERVGDRRVFRLASNGTNHTIDRS